MKMNCSQKKELLTALINEVRAGNSIYWSGSDETRFINYERAADELTADWCVFNEFLRLGKHEAAGKLVAEANLDALAWLINQALDDYDVAPDGYFNEEFI